MTRPWARMDTPLPVLILQLAAARTSSLSDHLAYDLDAWLIEHPEAPVSVDADFPGWAEHVAAREADNRKTRNALKETP